MQVFTYHRDQLDYTHCDPECLLQGPEASELPKVVRRGAKGVLVHVNQKLVGVKEVWTGATQGCNGAGNFWEFIGNDLSLAQDRAYTCTPQLI